MSAAPTHRRRPTRIVCLATLAGTLATGCASGGGHAVVLTPPSSLDTSAPTPTAQPTKAFEANTTYQINAEAADGSTAHYQLSFGDLAKVDGYTPPSDFQNAPTACFADPQRDAIVPVRLTAMSTTSGFSIDMPFGFERVYGFTVVSDPPAYRISVSSDAVFSDGPNCRDNAQYKSVFGVQYNAASTNQTYTTDFYLVLHDFYSPSTPNGDYQALAGVAFVPSIYSDATGTWRVTGLAGPGVYESKMLFNRVFTMFGSPADEALIALGYP